MAEFSEVMRQFDRMCKAHGGCIDCPLAIKNTIETKCNIGSFIDESEYIEREVMSWAAGHPEPVYPTWREWLIELGIVSFDANFRTLYDIEPTTLTNTVKAYINEEGSKPIPADIARKLELKPKGVK